MINQFSSLSLHVDSFEFIELDDDDDDIELCNK